jgi:hypothetical protein
LTDLGSNCFGDANIGPLCVLSILSWILLSWVVMLLRKNIDLEKGCMGVYPLLLDFCSGCGLRVSGCFILHRPPRTPLKFFSLLSTFLPCSLSSLLCDSGQSVIVSNLSDPKREERSLSLLPLCSKLTSLNARSYSKTPKVVIVRSERRNHGRLFVVMSRWALE